MKVLDHINEHKYSIFMHSDISGDIHQQYIEYIMLYINENSNKNITFVSSNSGELFYIRDYINEHYKDHLENTTSTRKMNCVNNNTIHFTSAHKHFSVGYNHDVVFILSAGYYQKAVIDMIYKSIYPYIAYREDTKLILSSCLNGKSWFYDKFKDAENGKNEYVSKRIYFWELSKKYNGDWVSDMIKCIGEKEFNLKFNLSF